MKGIRNVQITIRDMPFSSYKSFTMKRLMTLQEKLSCEKRNTTNLIVSLIIVLICKETRETENLFIPLWRDKGFI